jgi:restriction system protein
MALPDFQTLMLPVLKFVAARDTDTGVRTVSEAMAAEFRLTPEELARLLPSGRAPQFYNRVQWTITHLRKAGLLSTPRRGHVGITQRSRELLAKNPTRIDMKTLAQYEE